MRGHIRKRGKGWRITIYLGRDPATNRKRWKAYSHKTREEAQAHLTQILSAMQGGGWTPPAKVRLGDYLERWLKDYAASAVRVTTFDGYRMICRRHLAPALGHVPLNALSAVAIQGYLTGKLQGKKDAQGKWVEKPLSSSTVRRHVGVLHRALHNAVRWGLLPANPCDRVDPPRPERFEPRVWDEEQALLFLGEAKRSSCHYCLYLAAVTTGMRQGELLGLRWQDVDLTLGRATVKQTLYRLGGSKKDGQVSQVLFGEPKSAKSRRTIPLLPILVEELHRLKAEQDENRRLLGTDYHDHGLVFCQANGAPLHAHNICRRDFRRVIKRAKLPRIRFHDLRHSHATDLLAHGELPKLVSERLGHSSVAFTMQVYSHVLPGMQEQAAARLQARLFGNPQPAE